MEVFAAKQWRLSISNNPASNLYLTIGRTLPWTNESSPPQGNTSVNAFYDVWNNMIGAKRVTGNDVRHCIPRFNWAANTVYCAYDDMMDSRDLKNANNQFYVVTSDYNVYKCLANNYGTNSTSMPTSINTTTDFQTQDGYIWKYMYTIADNEQLRFMTPSYIPVKTLSMNDGSLQWPVQNNAISGAIHNIVLSNTGSYTANDIYISITGDGQDANAFAIRNVTSNTIQSIVIDNRGINYSYAIVTVNSPTGSGAIARAIISPPGGHGSDPVTELGGSYLITNIRFKGSKNGKLPVTNDYHQIALLENPVDYNTGMPTTNSVISQTTQITLNGSSVDYQLDETVYQGNQSNPNFTGKVVAWDSANNRLYLSNVTGVPTSQLVTGATSTASRFLSSITQPDMSEYTGNLLYIDNITPIQRAPDQMDDFSIVISF